MARKPAPFLCPYPLEKRVFLQPQRRANRRCAALSRSVQRLKGARLSAGLGVTVVEFLMVVGSILPFNMKTPISAWV